MQVLKQGSGGPERMGRTGGTHEKITPVRTDPEARCPRPLLEGRVPRVVRMYVRRHVSI